MSKYGFDNLEVGELRFYPAEYQYLQQRIRNSNDSTSNNNTNIYSIVFNLFSR